MFKEFCVQVWSVCVVSSDGSVWKICLCVEDSVCKRTLSRTDDKLD